MDKSKQNEKIKQLWILLNELAELGVQIGISGSLKNGYSMKVKFIEDPLTNRKS